MRKIFFILFFISFFTNSFSQDTVKIEIDTANFEDVRYVFELLVRINEPEIYQNIDNYSIFILPGYRFKNKTNEYSCNKNIEQFICFDTVVAYKIFLLDTVKQVQYSCLISLKPDTNIVYWNKSLLFDVFLYQYSTHFVFFLDYFLLKHDYFVVDSNNILNVIDYRNKNIIEPINKYIRKNKNCKKYNFLLNNKNAKFCFLNRFKKKSKQIYLSPIYTNNQ